MNTFLSQEKMNEFMRFYEVIGDRPHGDPIYVKPEFIVRIDEYRDNDIDNQVELTFKNETSRIIWGQVNDVYYQISDFYRRKSA